MSSALRGTGLVKPTMTVQLLAILVNVALAPVLIAGWGTGKPMGVAGAGLASTIAGIFGVTMLTFYFLKLEKYVAFHRRPVEAELRLLEAHPQHRSAGRR